MVTQDIKDWWTKTLLGEQRAAHPIFGSNVDIDVDGDVVTLGGEVESPEQAEELEREARGLPTVRSVINRITVKPAVDPQHLQTIVAVFPDVESARLACQKLSAQKSYESEDPAILENGGEAESTLRRLGRAAHVPEDGLQRYIDELAAGKVLLIDRVPEDHAFQVISALEGWRMSAESIRTLPPEQESIEGSGA